VSDTLISPKGTVLTHVATMKTTLEKDDAAKRISVTRVFKIMLDPGHGDHNDENSMVDPGAVAKHDGKTYKEKDMALQFAKAVGKVLAGKGHTVVYTRESDIDNKELEKLQWRVDMAEEQKVDAFVSIHLDAAVGKSSGLSVYANSKADAIKKSVEESVKAIDVRHPKSKSLHVLRENKDRAAILIEAGFITNSVDQKIVEGAELSIEVATGIDAGLRK